MYRIGILQVTLTGDCLTNSSNYLSSRSLRERRNNYFGVYQEDRFSDSDDADSVEHEEGENAAITKPKRILGALWGG